MEREWSRGGVYFGKGGVQEEKTGAGRTGTHRKESKGRPRRDGGWCTGSRGFPPPPPIISDCIIF